MRGKSTIYYIDIRAIDRFEEFYQSVKENENVSFIKSKVASVVENRERTAIRYFTVSTPKATTATPPSMIWWYWL